MEKLQEVMAGTPQVAEALDAMEREYQHLFKSFQDFSDRRLEATVQAQLERRQLGEQFRVLEAAYRAPEPSSPNRLLIVIIGVIIGLAMGAGIGIVLEAADGSIHNARQLQVSFDLPVLVTIPEIWLESDRMRRRRSRILTAFATMTLIVFGLAGGAANYMWVNGGRGGDGLAPAATGTSEGQDAIDSMLENPDEGG
jgi:uncharacterized membrane-anchored protein YhcB (DUF1043 family)